MIVNMPVEVLCEKCAHCPELDVNTITKDNVLITGIDENGNVIQERNCESHLRCANVEKCKIMYDAVFKPDEPKKKVDTKTTKAKTTKEPANKSTTRKKKAE